MIRRRFLREGVAGCAIAAGGVGFLFLQRGRARAAMNAQFLEDALPPLEANSLQQLQALPARGREEIRRYFHGKCLNVESFIQDICSNGFQERLSGCLTDEDRQACLLASFCGRVATESEILDQVNTIATEIGSEIDSAWGGYCLELSTKWNTHIGYGDHLTADALNSRVSGLIRSELGQAIRLAETASQRAAVGPTTHSIGKAALLLLRLIRFRQVGLAIGVPLFLVTAARPVWDFIQSHLKDKRGDYQTAISARIAQLGNRVGGEFERELRQRLTDLHVWQVRSIRESANVTAQERVGLF